MEFITTEKYLICLLIAYPHPTPHSPWNVTPMKEKTSLADFLFSAERKALGK